VRSRVIPVVLVGALLGLPAGWAAHEALPLSTVAAPSPSATPSSASPSASASATASPVPSATFGPAPDYRSVLGGAPVIAGQKLHGSVIDVETGAVLASSGAEAKLPPASSLKVISAAAILRELDPTARLSTTVTSGRPGALTLRGTGDVMLGSGVSDAGAVQGRAGLGSLAQQVAGALGKGSVPSALTLTVDDSLFPEALNSAWPAGDVATGQMTRLSPLAVASAFVDESSVKGARVADPALEAGKTFAAALTKELAARGHAVTVKVARSSGAAGGSVLGTVESAPIGDQLEYALVESDNYVIESLARVAALHAGKPATSAGVVSLAQAALPSITAFPSEVHVVDVSGLSAQNSVAPRAMASAVRGLVSSPIVALRREAGGFPVAGLSGTLAGRFGAREASEARGLVLAKTGTLNATSVLAGYATGPDGRTVAFSLTYDGIEGSLAEAKAAIDSVAARFVTG
jgi:D-alanyl-D-alanine carboxypeptidase/D-alanyl-D-alanine-endopeptidase (penicillin-binding protein 4)